MGGFRVVGEGGIAKLELIVIAMRCTRSQSRIYREKRKDKNVRQLMVVIEKELRCRLMMIGISRKLNKLGDRDNDVCIRGL